jgi:hypothetical protein
MMMHVHSVYSHDACDKHGLIDGRINEKCLKRFHQAICKNNYDIVFLTEHRGHLSEMPYGDALPMTSQDDPILEKGVRVGLRHACEGGRTVHVFLGSENQLMPIGMTRHPDPPAGLDLEQTYNSMDPAAVAAFRATGAIIGANHIEMKENPIEKLREVKPDFLEAYNIHANLLWIVKDKKVGRIWKYLTRMGSFIANPFVEPDLLFLTFFREDETTLQRWSQLSMTQKVGAVGGIDAHENFLPGPMWDGDRPDSYRRLARWFSNWVYLPSETPTRQEALDAVKASRMILAFEIFGDPSGFQFQGSTARGAVVPMGSELNLADTGGSIDLHVTPPASIPSGLARLRILKATDQGWVSVAENDAKAELVFTTHEPGVFRAEIRTTPSHLGRHVPGFKSLVREREYPWAMANPIFVR